MRLLIVAILMTMPRLVLARDGSVTPKFLCEEFAGESSPACLRCAARILPRADEVVDRCEAKCIARYRGDDLEICKINCLSTYEVHFKNNCMR